MYDIACLLSSHLKVGNNKTFKKLSHVIDIINLVGGSARAQSMSVY